jgi:hypothetical protein
MKHLFSIQNDACCKNNLYIVYVMYHIYAQFFFCDGRYCDGRYFFNQFWQNLYRKPLN